MTNKKGIQDELKKRLGLYVDVVQQDSRTSNTGNSSSQKARKITEANVELIKRFAIILQIITEAQTLETAKSVIMDGIIC